MPPNQPQNLELTFKTKTLSHDGQATIINTEVNGLCVINFIQMRPPKNDIPQADVVASVSFPTIGALKKFLADTSVNIEQHEKREK